MGSLTSRSKGGSSKGGSGEREYGQINFELITAVEMDKVEVNSKCFVQAEVSLWRDRSADALMLSGMSSWGAPNLNWGGVLIEKRSMIVIKIYRSIPKPRVNPFASLAEQKVLALEATEILLGTYSVSGKALITGRRETDDTVAVVGNILDADSEVIGRMSLVVTMTFPDFGDVNAPEPGLGLEQGPGVGPGLGLSTTSPFSPLQGMENSTIAVDSPITGLGAAKEPGLGQGLDIRPITLNTLTDKAPQDQEPLQPLDRPPRAGKGLPRDGEDFQRKRQQLIADMQNLRSNLTPADNAILQQRQTLLMQAQQQQLLAQSQPATQYDPTGYPINTPLITKPNLHLVADPSFAQAQGLAQKVVGSLLEQVIASFVALETQSDFYRPPTGREGDIFHPGPGGGNPMWMTSDDFDMGGMEEVMQPVEGEEERGVGVALFGDDYDNDHDDEDEKDDDNGNAENEATGSNDKGENEGKKNGDVPVALTIHALTGLLRSSSAPSQRSIGSDSRASESTSYGTVLVDYISDALDHPLRGVPTPDHPGLHEKWREAPGRTNSGLGRVKAVQAPYDSDNNEDDDDEIIALTHGATSRRPLDNNTNGVDPLTLATSRDHLQELQELQDLIDSPRSSPTRLRSPPRPGGGSGSPTSKSLAAGGFGLDSTMGGSSMPAAFTRPITFADDGVTDLRRRARANLPHPAARALPQHRFSSLPPQYWHLGVTFTFEHLVDLDLTNTLLGQMAMGGQSHMSEMGGGIHMSEMRGGMEGGSGVSGEDGAFHRSIDMDFDPAGVVAGVDGDDAARPVVAAASPTDGSVLGLRVDTSSRPPVGDGGSGGNSVVSGGSSSLLSKKSLMRLPVRIAVSARYTSPLPPSGSTPVIPLFLTCCYLCTTPPPSPLCDPNPKELYDNTQTPSLSLQKQPSSLHPHPSTFTSPQLCQETSHPLGGRHCFDPLPSHGGWLQWRTPLGKHSFSSHHSSCPSAGSESRRRP